MVIVDRYAVDHDLQRPGGASAPSAWPARDRREELAGRLLIIRRAAILGIVLAGYLVHRALGQSQGLAAIGLVSFAAIAQLAPAFFMASFKQGYGASDRGIISPCGAIRCCCRGWSRPVSCRRRC
jgi:hypothetical protein